MALLKDRKFAALIMAVMIVLSILGGAHRSLSALRSEAEAVFYNEISGRADAFYGRETEEM